MPLTGGTLVTDKKIPWCKTLGIHFPKCFESELSLLCYSNLKLKVSFLHSLHLIFSQEDRNIAGKLIQTRNHVPFSYAICILRFQTTTRPFHHNLKTLPETTTNSLFGR